MQQIFQIFNLVKKTNISSSLDKMVQDGRFSVHLWDRRLYARVWICK